MGFNADDFLLVRNPAIKIIGKRNEREGGSTSTAIPRPEIWSAKPAVTPRNQDSTNCAASEIQKSPHTVAAAAAATAVSSPLPSPANEKPEPRLATTTTKSTASVAAATAASAAAALVPLQQAAPSPESSQLWSSKEEASSRLEALLKNTAPHCTSADKNDRRQRDLKNHSGLCHLVKFEAKRPSLQQQATASPPSNSKSRLPRLNLRPVQEQIEKPVQHLSSKGRKRSRGTEGNSEAHHTDYLTDLWSETHKDSHKEDLQGQEQAGKRYRSSIRIMVRPEAVQQLQRPVRANSSDGLSRSTSTSSEAASAKAAKKMSAAGVRAAPNLSELDQPQRPTTRPIVKEQFR